MAKWRGMPLDKLAGDPVDILVNGRLIARGVASVLNDNFLRSSRGNPRPLVFMTIRVLLLAVLVSGL